MPQNIQSKYNESLLSIRHGTWLSYTTQMFILFKVKFNKHHHKHKSTWTKWKFRWQWLATLISSFHFLLLMNRASSEGNRRTSNELLGRRSFKERPPCADEGSSSRAIICKNQAKGPIENVWSEDPIEKENVIPAWVLYVRISPAGSGYD